MKKIIITMVMIIPLLFVNKVMAQSNPQQQDFTADVTVTSQCTCPNTGIMIGYVPVLGSTTTEYYGTIYNYTLIWLGNFPGYQPCTVEVTTDVNAQGDYCQGENTKDLSLYNNDITVEIWLIAEDGGNNEN